MLVITDETSREELAESISNMCHRAKREIAKVGNEDHPTGWDKRHATINAMLDDLERAT